jgi:hypothetical protein
MPDSPGSKSTLRGLQFTFVTNPIRCAAATAATRRFTDKGTPEVILGRKAKAFEILDFRLPILD